MMVNVGIVDFGYWTPDVIRNFVSNKHSNMISCSDLRKKGLERISTQYPHLRTMNYVEFLSFSHVFFFFQTVFYLFAIIGFGFRNSQKVIKIFYIPMYFCIIGVAGIVSLFKYLRGSTFATWVKP